MDFIQDFQCTWCMALHELYKEAASWEDYSVSTLSSWHKCTREWRPLISHSAVVTWYSCIAEYVYQREWPNLSVCRKKTTTVHSNTAEKHI